MIQVKRLISARAFVTPAKGTDGQNDKYCSKEGDVFLKIGEVTDATTPRGGFGSYKEAKVIAEEMAEGRSLVQIAEDDEKWAAWCKHSKTIKEFSELKKQEKMKENAKKSFEDCRFKRWQKDLLNLIEKKPDDREIYWYFDQMGSTGKTFLSKYLTVECGAIRFENGKSADIKFAYGGEKIVIFDLCRSQSDHFNYEALESLKNGMIFSPKYESKSKIFEIPHVIVFANWEPDKSKLSFDRWNIHSINHVEDMEWLRGG